MPGARGQGGQPVQQQKRGRGEANKGRHSAREAGPAQADAKTDLAGTRPRQKLAQGDQPGIGLAIDPVQFFNKGPLKIADMGGRAAKAHTAEREEPVKDFPDFLHGWNFAALKAPPAALASGRAEAPQ